MRRFWTLTARSPIQRDSRGGLLCWVEGQALHIRITRSLYVYSNVSVYICIFQRFLSKRATLKLATAKSYFPILGGGHLQNKNLKQINFLAKDLTF